jgi:ElaB/YqjD/DUF883 family membrane-anchored ribosome-binding protein
MKTFERLPLVPGDRIDTAKLMADLRILATDTEQLLNATASQTGQHIAEVRARAGESLQTVKAGIANLQDAALVRARAAGSATDDYVRANPWQAMAIGAAAGLGFGLVLAMAASTDSSSTDS